MTKRKKRLHYTGKNPRLVKEDRMEDQRIVKKIREEVGKERRTREKQQLPKKLKEKWNGFIAGRKIGREIKKKEREHNRERRKRILPDEGFGD